MDAIGTDLLTAATETARTLAAKPAGALQASKRLMKAPFHFTRTSESPAAA
jgi:hypothetical protein